MRLHDLRQIHDSYQHIYLSPHFDDAALSCGGAIMRQRSQGQRVLVVTVCSGTPPPDAPLNLLAQQFHAEWSLAHEQVIVTRHHEDAAAMERIDADYFYLDLLDAIYRLPGYDSREVLFAGRLLPDDPLPEQIRTAIESFFARTPQATIYCPLAIGGHVDHQATFQACELFAREGRSVVFYEDVPYVLEPGSGEQRRAAVGALADDVLEIGPWLDEKLAAIAAYDSQLVALFGSRDAMREAIAGYAHALGAADGTYAERQWRFTTP